MNKDEKNNFGEEYERIAKTIARAGICSRRDAEKLILEGRVVLNGKTLETPACKVSVNDQIEIDGKILQKKQQPRLFLYHKPVGLLTTNRDDRGRKTIFDDLPEGLPRLISVGRLDLNTEGLLLLTNDGELSRYLELPATGWKRTYRVRVYGDVENSSLKKLKDGIIFEGVQYGSIDAFIEKGTERGHSGRNTWINMTLTEGKNREIRNVMRALGLQVNRLIRTSYGGFQLEGLKVSDTVECSEEQLRTEISEFFK